MARLVKRYANLQELSTYCGYSRQYISKLVNQNDIPYIRPDGAKRVMFDLDDVDAWMSKRKYHTAVGRVVAPVQQKGGVGKTTITVNLATESAARGNKSLIIDMDPQASATGNCFSEPLAEGTIYTALKEYLETDDPRVIKKAIHPVTEGGYVNENLFIIPGDDRLYDLRGDLEKSIHQRKSLHNMLKTIKSDYSYIFIDTAPSELGVFATTILTATDYALIVTEASQYSVEALSRLDNLIRRLKNTQASDPDTGLMEVLGVVVNKFRENQASHTAMLESISDMYHVIQPHIPFRAQVHDAEYTREPLIKSRYSADVAVKCSELATSIFEMIAASLEEADRMRA